METISQVLSFLPFLIYLSAFEIKDVSEGKYKRVIGTTILSGLFIARYKLLHMANSSPFLSALVVGVIVFLLLLCFVMFRQKKKAMGKRVSSHRVRRVYRMGLIKYQKVLDWLYSSHPEKYAEELEQRGYRIVNSNMRLFFLCALLPSLSFSYWSIGMFTAAAVFGGILCIGRIVQKYFFRVLGVMILVACGIVWMAYTIEGYESMRVSLFSGQPILQLIFDQNFSEVQTVMILCLYLSSIFALVTIFVGGPLATIRYTFVKFLCLVKSIAVRTSLFKRQQRKASQKRRGERLKIFSH